MNVALKHYPPESRRIGANGLEFCVETRGNPSGEPVVFIMGLGAQMTLWPESLLNAYAEAGYWVVRFDNRDIGLSTHLKAHLQDHPLKAMLNSRLGRPVAAPYTLHDMAADVGGLMDALEIGRAHLVGVSMGGMITQVLAGDYPQRVRSATLVMTSTNSPRLPMPKLGLVWRLSGIGVKGHDEDAVVARSLDFWRAIQSPDYPTAPHTVRERLISDYRRAYHPAGILRQTRAILASGSLSSITRRIQAPTAIIHGAADPLIRPVAAEQLQYLIPHAQARLIPGMGHDLPEPLVGTIAETSLGVMGLASR
ncbi:alpha/beta fold hydrolase [Marinobacter sp. JSM 1782161]|uniref:alpha/beta fold hydrolase n=1 Tax=Marinobacter sp. JSM 1782161 TaxID=2685906 RepID=UPI001403EEEE|nr:alpha/beta fold hydrolase [Marinobacter sp. JSM 1782161]